MNKEYKCPTCGCSDFKVENGYYMCQICGHQEVIPQEETVAQQASLQQQSCNKGKYASLNKYCKYGIGIGIFGLVLFLGIVFIGLILYGEVYLYDGYEFTAVLTTISIFCMQVGWCNAIVKTIIYFINKKANN